MLVLARYRSENFVWIV